MLESEIGSFYENLNITLTTKKQHDVHLYDSTISNLYLVELLERKEL